MARYKLTAAHFVTRANGIPAYLEAGTTIDRLEMPPHWEPTPLMQPLDDEAYAAHSEVMQRSIAKSGVEITGIGHLRNLPNGERHLAAAELTPSPSGAIYWLDKPLQYTSRAGIERIADPRDAGFLRVSYWRYNPVYRDYREGAGNMFDPADPYWEMPPDWTPPVVGVRPMNAAAKAELDRVRAGMAGRQIPGVGYVPRPDEDPIYRP